MNGLTKATIKMAKQICYAGTGVVRTRLLIRNRPPASAAAKSLRPPALAEASAIMRAAKEEAAAAAAAASPRAAAVPEPPSVEEMLAAAPSEEALMAPFPAVEEEEVVAPPAEQPTGARPHEAPAKTLVAHEPAALKEPAASASAGVKSAIDRLKDLKFAYENELITKEEYDKKKREVMANM